jgi:hypothetical protein
MRRLLLGLLVPVIVALGLTSTHAAAASSPRPILSAMTGGNTTNAEIREKRPRADGYRHIDTPATIAALKAMHANTYTFGVWEGDKDWDDLRNEFAPAAQRAGIDIMVYLVPPSECFDNPEKYLQGKCSRPYELDFVAWAKQIATLSKQYGNITSWAIDDFLSGPVNRALFTKPYLADVRAAQDSINPDLRFYVTLYFGEIVPANLDLISDSLDGVILPYLGTNADTNDVKSVPARVDSALSQLQPYHLQLIFLAYTGRYLASVLEPHEDTVGAILDRVRPYLADGRVRGIIAYAAPIDTRQQPSYTDRARTGSGRLSLSINSGTGTAAGDYVQAAQRIQVDPNAATKELTFYTEDPFGGWALSGYEYKQVLVDGQVVWESDVTADPGTTWLRTDVDLTDALAGKTAATVALRFVHKNGVGDFPADIGFDDVSGRGVHIDNGTFERDGGWQISGTTDALRGFIDIYRADRPTRILNAIGARYAAVQGRPYRPIVAPRPPPLHVGEDNRAYTGNGRLSFTQPAGVTAPAGSCASASQEVAVTPGLPRYELSFWHADPYALAGEHVQFKEIAIDGFVLWKRSTRDPWPWYYLHGSDHQGAIDVTRFVAGKRRITLEFKLCNDQPTSGVDMDASFDHLESIGLQIRNPDFERPGDWSLSADAPLSARIAIAH